MPNPAALTHCRVSWRDELLVCEGFDSREFFAFEEFEAGAAARGDVRDLVRYAGLVDGAYGVAASDDGGCGLVAGNGAGNGIGPLGKVREFEYSCGAVPYDGAGMGDDFFNGGDRLGTDVETLPVGRKVLRRIPCLGLCVVREAVGEDIVDRKQQVDSLCLGFLQSLLGELDLVFFNKGLTCCHAFRTIEGVSHAADDHERVDFVEQVLDNVDFA